MNNFNTGLRILSLNMIYYKETYRSYKYSYNLITKCCSEFLNVKLIILKLLLAEFYHKLFVEENLLCLENYASKYFR